ncbi:ChrR family anti-sigma-E factor [Mesobacterium sp. TK19101]|uniref:ChrR family anti-sigma-E factor n=1 Tax=Mesobacterium hydrothermale TaxID=3111907 RepID=A0ABU6HK76_9RHOB|nr:ChrR family anti-sigma-E factor [Mesobacterium sp. TK19101]MEC3862862.1 ChrR family anti-sigma-E factor [Mesobacterium sp. TK19101]
MTIKHHLTDALLMGYSSGSLPEAFNLIVAAHLSLCDECRAHLASFDAVGGEVLEGTSATPVSDSCLDGAMALIRGATPVEPAPVRPRDKTLPAPVLDYVGGSLDNVKWRSAGMGVKQAILPTSPEASARLLYIPAGVAVPDHGHNGLELTLVLQGAFADEEGYFARGDIEVADEEVEHLPVADISEDCICLAVTDAPLRFKGLLPRLAQPFLKI